MTIETEPRRSRRRRPIAIARALAAVATAGAAAAAIMRLRSQEGTHISMSITIDRPVGEVFAFVSDATNVLEWLPAAVERHKVTDGPIGVGTRYEATDRIAGRRIDHTQEIIGFEQDRLVRTKLSAPWDGVYDIRVAPVEGGTLLSVDTTGRPTGVFRVLDLLPASVLRRLFERDYARLKELLEGRAEPAPTPDAVRAIPIEPMDQPVGPARVPEEMPAG